MNVKVGDVFGYLEVIKLNNSHSRGKSWLCKCICGKERIYYTSALIGSTDGKVKRSCGCRKYARNGLVSKNIRLYKAWYAMNSRCYNPNHISYNRYGAKGIGVDEIWRNDYEPFYNWAMTNGYEDHLTLDRIDSTKDYSPGNCRWETTFVQAQNKGIHSVNKTGVNGSTLDPNGRYRAYITRDNIRMSLGYHDTIKEVEEARERALAYYEEHGTLKGHKPIWNRLRKESRYVR